MFSTAQILIVEDEAIVAQDISNQLVKLGYSIAAIAHSGEDAVRLATTHGPDLILLDIHLTGKMDGIETAHAIQEYSDVPIIYLTAFADEETLQRAQITAPYGYVLKPFETRALHSAIEMSLYRHKTERNLKKRESQFRTLAESIPGAILIVRPVQDCETWDIVYANPAAQNLTEYTIDELLEMKNFEFIIPDLRDSFTQQMIDALGVQNSAEFELQFLTKHRSLRWVSCSLDLIEYEETIALLVTGFDITTRKESEQQRVELEAEKARVEFFRHFIGEVAHDFKSPLSTIKIGLHIINTSSDPEKKTQYLDVLKMQISHLERMLQDMFSMAHLEMIPELYIQEAFLNEIVQQILNAQELAFSDKQHRFEFTPDSHVPPLFIDVKLITRAVTNILVNAIIYTPPGGVIRVQTQNLEHGVAIQVSDTGIGISAADLPHIFDRFYRADRTNNGHLGGTGLGLSIAQKIVKLHGGTIEVNSTLTKGSTFKIILPNESSNRAPSRQNDQRLTKRAGVQLQTSPA